MSENASPTSQLINHVLGIQASSLPENVLAQAKVVFADEVGILLAASTERTVNTAIKAMPLRGNGGCTVVGHGKGATPEQAALLNGCGGHDIELDDSHSPARNHPASVQIPTALAAAEYMGGSTGGEMLAGIVAGYDAQVRMSKAMGSQDQFERGFHPTSVCGTVGSAVCAGRIMGLTEDQMHQAITLATSQSCGTLAWHDDSTHMVKSFQPAVAARNGITAALFAQQGFQGIRDVFTNRYSPLKSFGRPAPDFNQLTDALGVRYDICETSIKRHACGGQTHSALDALLTIMADNGLVASDIDAIDAQLAHDAIPIIDNNPLLIANIQFVLALGAHVGLIKREHFSPEWTENADIWRLKERVSVRDNDELSSRFPAMKGAIVTVEAKGETFVHTYPTPPGSPSRPLSIGEVKDKFTGLATAVLRDETADELWSLLKGFEKISDTSRLFEILAG